MPVRGPHYNANGIMIYAMAYGKPANDKLERLNAEKLPFEDQPARLKPLNSDAVTFVPTGVAKQGNFNAVMGNDKRTLIIQFDSSNKPEVAVISGVFRNDFFPYDIHSADVSMNVKFEVRTMVFILKSILANWIRVYGRGIFRCCRRDRNTAFAQYVDHPEIIFKSGYQVQAIMEFTLANQELKLSPDFIKRMNVLFPGDPLPEIFVLAIRLAIDNIEAFVGKSGVSGMASDCFSTFCWVFIFWRSFFTDCSHQREKIYGHCRWHATNLYP